MLFVGEKEALTSVAGCYWAVQLLARGRIGPPKIMMSVGGSDRFFWLLVGIGTKVRNLYFLVAAT